MKENIKDSRKEVLKKIGVNLKKEMLHTNFKMKIKQLQNLTQSL